MGTLLSVRMGTMGPFQYSLDHGHVTIGTLLSYGAGRLLAWLAWDDALKGRVRPWLPWHDALCTG